jgi:DNA invertase Pin-like site-specific DNA recombinase
MLQIYAAMAEQEAENISARTKAALAVAKARGTRLGNPNLQPGSVDTARVATEARQAYARDHAAIVAPYITAARKAGASSLTQLAEALTARGVRTPSGGNVWHPATVSRIINYAAA